MGCVVPSFLGDQLRGDERDAARCRSGRASRSRASPSPSIRACRPAARAKLRDRMLGWQATRPWPRSARASGLARNGASPTDADYDGVRRARRQDCAPPPAAEPMTGWARLPTSVPAAADRADDPLPRGRPGRRRAVRHAAPLAEHHQNRACCSGSRHDRTTAGPRADRAAHRRVRQPAVLHRATRTNARGSGRSRSSTCLAGSWRRAMPRRSAHGRSPSPISDRTRPALADREPAATGWAGCMFTFPMMAWYGPTAAPTRLGLTIAVAGMLVIALVGWWIGHLLTRKLARLAAVADVGQRRRSQPAGATCPAATRWPGSAGRSMAWSIVWSSGWKPSGSTATA